MRIGEGTWVGSAAVVMADVGRHCVIGAGAVVTRPLPDYSVAVGVPARVIRSRRRSATARVKVLFLTHRLPYAPNRGDRIRAYYLLREMARFASVSLVFAGA